MAQHHFYTYIYVIESLLNCRFCLIECNVSLILDKECVASGLASVRRRDVFVFVSVSISSLSYS